MEDGLVSGLLASVLLVVLGSLILSRGQQPREMAEFQVRLFAWAFAVRFAASLAIYEGGLVRVIGDDDASGWGWGVFFYWNWQQHHLSIVDLPFVLSEAFDGHHRGYFYLLGAWFFLIDSPSRLAAAALNCFFGALTVVMVWRIAAVLFSSSVASLAGWLACFFPSLILWSSQTVKEPVVIFLETLVLYGSIQLKRLGFSAGNITLCCLAIVLLIPFRFYAVYLAGAAVLMALAWPHFSGGRTRLGAAIGIAVLTIPLLMLTGTTKQHEQQFQSMDAGRIQSFKNAVAKGGSGVEMNYDLNTPSGMGIATLVGGAHLLLAPFPWQLGSGTFRKLATMPELVFWWWLFIVGVIPGVIYSIRNRFSEVQPLLFFLLGMGLLYSVMFGNVGLAYRQRAQLLPWLLIFAAVGLHQRMLKRSAKRSLLSSRP